MRVTVICAFLFFAGVMVGVLGERYFPRQDVTESASQSSSYKLLVTVDPTMQCPREYFMVGAKEYGDGSAVILTQEYRVRDEGEGYEIIRAARVSAASVYQRKRDE